MVRALSDLYAHQPAKSTKPVVPSAAQPRTNLCYGAAVLLICGLNGFALPAGAQELEFDPTFQIMGFADKPTEGTLDDDTRFSGRFDVFLTVRNIWSGGTLNAQLEYANGDDFIGFGGDLGGNGLVWTTNMLSATPRSLSTNNAGLSLSVNQRITDQTSLTLGKFNVVQIADNAPISGGRGKGSFQYLGIGAPPSFVFPPYALGAQLAIATDPVSYSFFVYDANTAAGEDYWDDLFTDGVTFNASATYKTQLGGKPGFYTGNLIYTTKGETDFTSLEEFDGSAVFVNEKDGVFLGAFKFQQYLSFDPAKPDEGWGLFGQVGFGSDGLRLSRQFVLGVAGTSPLHRRGNDRWGLAWAKYKWADGLKKAIAINDGVELQNEWAVEAFYEAEINETFRIGANVMFVQPTIQQFDDLIQFGMRLRATF